MLINMPVRWRKRGIVQFIHESVRDFLVQSKGFQILDSTIGDNPIGVIQDQMTRSCISYLATVEELYTPTGSSSVLPGGSDKIEYLLRQYPLLRYTAKYMFAHASKADLEGISQAHLVEDLQRPPYRGFDGFRACWRYFKEIDPLKCGDHPPSLMYAASKYNVFSCVSALLRAGESPNIRGGAGEYPLHVASRNGHKAVVRLLLEHGAHIDPGSPSHWTALHYAANSGHYEVMEVLLDENAAINAKVFYGSTALHIAIESHHEHIIRLLLNRGADIEANSTGGQTPLHCAAWSVPDDVRLIQLILDNGANITAVTEEGETVLHLAARSRKVESANFLLERGADINIRTLDGETVLHEAFRGYELLFNREAYSMAESSEELRLQKELILLLLEKGLDIETAANNGERPLHVAAKLGFPGVVQFALENNANVNTKTHDGSTALHIAISCDNCEHSPPRPPLESIKQVEEMVQVLLRGGADVSARNRFGETALHFASDRRLESIIWILMENGADIDARDIDALPAVNKEWLIELWGGLRRPHSGPRPKYRRDHDTGCRNYHASDMTSLSESPYPPWTSSIDRYDLSY